MKKIISIVLLTLVLSTGLVRAGPVEDRDYCFSEVVDASMAYFEFSSIVVIAQEACLEYIVEAMDCEATDEAVLDYTQDAVGEILRQDLYDLLELIAIQNGMSEV